MRIAMLGHKRVPSREGGIEVVVEELGIRMAAMGHEVTFYNRNGKNVSGEKFNVTDLRCYKGMQIKSVPTIDRKGLAAISASFFAGIRAAFGKYDVVHFHAEGPCAMLWLPKLMGKRCIATIHGLDHQRSKWGALAKKCILLGEKCAVRFADEIIVLSSSNKKYFHERYGRDTRLIPNGVNRPDRREACEIKRKYGLEKDGYLLYLGRIVPEKGIHYLIEAFKRLDTDKKLVVAGGASDSEDYILSLRTLAEGDQRIIFTDFVCGRILEELYSNSYVYILPSDLEGMPLSLLEAMSYGNCCVVSDIPECQEVVGDKGVVFEKADVDALNSVLKELLCDKARIEKYKNESADYICKKYNWDEVVRDTVKLYQSCK